MRRRRPCCAALLWLLTACGGQVGADPSTGAGSATGGVSGATATSEEPPLVNSAGQEPGNSSGGAPPQIERAAGAGSDAGSAPMQRPAVIGSASRYCENDTYCFGLACYAPAELEAHVCVAACSTDADCASAEVCLESADLNAGCYRRCATPFDCEYGFDCFDFTNQHEMLVCFPTPWANLWQRENR
jgi:hypothetical protein